MHRIKVIVRALAAAITASLFPATGFADNHQHSTAPAKLSFQAWSVAERRLVTHDDFIDQLAAVPFVLLGEMHDNPDHHTIRAKILTDLTAARKTTKPGSSPPAAVFEHATVDRQPYFDTLNAEPERGADDDRVSAFFKAANWKKRGWPDKDVFRPLITAALNAQMPLYAGDVGRHRIMSVARGSSTPQSVAISASEIARLKLDQTLGKENNKASLSEIANAHCGVMPESMLGPMAYAQRLRDATMADVMLKAAEFAGSAVLITGNGHVRNDRGVPWYLRARGKRGIVTVTLREHSAPSTLARVADLAGIASDYAIFTASRDRPDPCEKLRKKFGKTKR